MLHSCPRSGPKGWAKQTLALFAPRPKGRSYICSGSPVTRDPVTPSADCRRSLAFFYSEYFRPTYRADALRRRSVVLEHDSSGVLDFSLLPTLHAVSCCHRYLLPVLVYVYCYYKNEPLSIPSGLFESPIGGFSTVLLTAAGIRGSSRVV